MPVNIFLAVLLLYFVTGCVTAPKPDKMILERTSFSSLSGWQDDRLSEALPAFIKSCRKISSLPKNTTIAAGIITGQAKDWQDSCTIALALEAADDITIRHFFEQEFVPFTVRNHDQEEGLFTGYYEIGLHGSPYKTSRYTEPLYQCPANISKPFYNRKEINDGALAGKNLEMLYVDDPVKSFFLHIQGSGRVQLEDGRVIRVGYAAQNGQPYFAIGRQLIEQGEIKKENMSAQAIKEWLYGNPAQAKSLMEKNPSYIFFRKIEGEGPIGGQGVALTPERSLAVDKHFIPYGLPIWLDTTYPKTPVSNAATFQKLLVSQDTGGAIRGPVRGDVFFGYGDQAEKLAEYMKNTGRYTLLLPRALAQKY